MFVENAGHTSCDENEVGMYARNADKMKIQILN